MKKIFLISLMLCLIVSLTGCGDSPQKSLSIENSFNLLDKPITDFPYYNMSSNEEYEVTLHNKEHYERKLKEIQENNIAEGDYELESDFYLQIDFKETADSSGFLGIKNFNVSNILVEFEYDYESSFDDLETKIIGIYFRFKDTVDEEYINRIMCTYFEDNEDDFVRTESKSSDYKYVFKYNEDKYVTFGESEYFWEYAIGFFA